MLKIGLLGNVNNNFFALTRYLRDRGLDAHLRPLCNDSSHFNPSKDTFSDDYKNYTKRLSWGNKASYIMKRHKVAPEVKEFDFIISCNYVPAFLHRAGKAVDMFMPHGCDILSYPFLNSFKSMFLPGMAYHQKQGIKNASYLMMDESNSDWENVVDKLQIKGERIKAPVPFLYTPEYTDENIENNSSNLQHYVEFKSLREKYEMIVFHHSSHIWKQIPSSWIPGSTKGNDKVIQGFASFLEKTGINACLILFEYGIDVDESRMLISELGIESNVKWFPLMPRREVMAGISQADIGIGEVGLSFLSYGTVYEFCAMGKPVMYRRDDSLYQGVYDKLFPIIDVANAEEVCDGLVRYSEKPEELQNMGLQARKWFLKNAIEKPLEEIIARIQS